jgi:phosphoribosylformylglycinamidine cyclo-ligase|uniref:Phosphoribosylformylglycinamidine cyclo-ligase n=1 Tax=candidate division WOR-3 bacterium TaxID=2052148 RepID=A0A7C4TGN1_UNCW3
MLYKNAGVDINRLNLIKKGIGKQVERTLPRDSLFGLFGGIYPMGDKYIVSSTDSVGTKILIACATGIHHTVGMDIVNHCVNDILTTGALPLFFMDYIGFSDVTNTVLQDIVKGLVKACKKEKMALIGGETAQLKRFYPKGVYDLVGFIVGIVNKDNYINPQKISPGDILLGLKSSGLHTNGYTLARKVLFKEYSLSSYVPELKCTLADELLKVHKSYRRELEPRLKHINGLAHITGGGFYDNIKRILPQGTSVVIKKRTWDVPPIFKLIQIIGKVPEEEMYRVFNMGIGMVVIINPEKLKYFKPLNPLIIGEVVEGNFGVRIE